MAEAECASREVRRPAPATDRPRPSRRHEHSLPRPPRRLPQADRRDLPHRSARRDHQSQPRGGSGRDPGGSRPGPGVSRAGRTPADTGRQPERPRGAQGLLRSGDPIGRRSRGVPVRRPRRRGVRRVRERDGRVVRAHVEQRGSRGHRRLDGDGRAAGVRAADPPAQALEPRVRTGQRLGVRAAAPRSSGPGAEATRSTPWTLHSSTWRRASGSRSSS